MCPHVQISIPYTVQCLDIEMTLEKYKCLRTIYHRTPDKICMTCAFEVHRIYEDIPSR